MTTTVENIKIKTSAEIKANLNEKVVVRYVKGEISYDFAYEVITTYRDMLLEANLNRRSGLYELKEHRRINNAIDYTLNRLKGFQTGAIYDRP